MTTPPRERQTSPFMTTFEYSKIIALRALQLANGGTPKVPINGISNALEIAKEELKNGRSTLMVSRKLPNGYVENCKATDLAIRDDAPYSFKE